MGDSSADLLFKVTADPTTAGAEMGRFRELLGRDLGTMGTAFDSWGERVLGSTNAVKGAMLGALGVGAGLVAALGAAMVTAAEKTAKFAGEIEDLTDKTGISAEQASKLRFAAEQTGGEFGKFGNALVFFERAAVQANNGSAKMMAAFRAVGVSQADLRAGMTDLVPLLYKASDGLRDMHSKAEQVAVGSVLFNRQFRELVETLTLGSRGFEVFAERASKLGRVLTEEDVVAVKAFKLASKELRAEWDGILFALGNSVMPILQRLAVLLIAYSETAKKSAKAGPIGDILAWGSYFDEVRKAQENLDKSLAAALAGAGKNRLDPPDPKAVKDTAREWNGLSSIMERVLGQLARADGPEDQMINTIRHLQVEIGKAGAEFVHLRDKGKLTAEAIARESAVIAVLPARVAALAASLEREMAEKKRIAAEQATTDLRERLNGLAEQDFATRRREFEREVNELRLTYEKKRQLTAGNEELLAQIRSAGLARIAREQSAEYQRELVDLQQHMAGIVTARMTAGERLAFQYQQDLQKLSEVEQARRAKSAGSPEERTILEEQAALNRSELLKKYGQDVVALENSQGWQGVFGSRFAQLLQHDEAALREWATSADQAFNLVGQSAVALRGLGMRAFDSLGQGMGANIAHAVIYSKSIREAMRAALAATVETIAAESLVQAIYASAIGFVRIAQHDYPAAAAAFQAAAIFGAVGGTAMAVGRAVAPRQEAAGAAGAGLDGVSGAAGQDEAAGGPRRNVTIILPGNIYGRQGIEEVCELINEYVTQRDGTLISTQARRTGGATA